MKSYSRNLDSEEVLLKLTCGVLVNIMCGLWTFGIFNSLWNRKCRNCLSEVLGFSDWGCVCKWQGLLVQAHRLGQNKQALPLQCSSELTCTEGTGICPKPSGVVNAAYWPILYLIFLPCLVYNKVNVKAGKGVLSQLHSGLHYCAAIPSNNHQ